MQGFEGECRQHECDLTYKCVRMTVDFLSAFLSFSKATPSQLQIHYVLYSSLSLSHGVLFLSVAMSTSDNRSPIYSWLILPCRCRRETNIQTPKASSPPKLNVIWYFTSSYTGRFQSTIVASELAMTARWRSSFEVLWAIIMAKETQYSVSCHRRDAGSLKYSGLQRWLVLIIMHSNDRRILQMIKSDISEILAYTV